MTIVPASVPVLRWAAQRARLRDDDLTGRFRKWPLWLSGEARPTLKQLEDFARITHTSIGYFFLPEPPTLALPVPDFRTLRDEAPAEPSSALLDTLYLCQQRQDWYREYARLHGLPALAFVGSACPQDAPETVAQRMRETLGLSTDKRRQLPTWTDALRQLIAKAEDAGVLVMASSVVGSNSHRKLDVGEFRGFTGTPLIDSTEKQLTRQVFGDYVSIYDFQRAVADGATLPLFYENRGEKLKIVDPRVSERIAQHIEAAKQAATLEDPWTDGKEDKLYRELARDYPILTSPTRQEKVAQDFVDHFHQRWRVVENGGSKAMIVCLDKITCVKMHDLIVFKWQERAAQLEADVAAEEALFVAKGKVPTPLLKQRREQVEWMNATEACVIVSQEQGEVAEFAKWKNFRDEPLDIKPHREKMVKRDLEKEFKKAENPFRIAIVCAMWLTGFDVKCLATLYLDKPMQGHTLMQAIARVNRVGGGKKHGLIIDYNGMLKSLRRALATFAQGDRAGTGKGESEQDTVRDDTEALAEYAESLQHARAYLSDLGFDLNTLIAATGFDKQRRILAAVNLLCENDERRKTYEVIVEDVQARHRGLFPHSGLFEFDAAESAVSAIYRKLQEARETPDVSELLQSLYEVVDTALTTDGPATRLITSQVPKQYDLSNIDFTRLRAEFERTPFKNVVTLNLKEKIEERLTRMVARNPTRVDLYERYQEIVKEYNKDKDNAEIQKVFDQLNAFQNSLDEEERRYLREGLEDEDQLAIFDLLQKDTLSKGDREAIKKVACELLEKLVAGKLQIDHWREKATAQAQIKAEIIKHLFAHLPSNAYDPAEIDLRANALFVHVYTSDVGDITRRYH